MSSVLFLHESSQSRCVLWSEGSGRMRSSELFLFLWSADYCSTFLAHSLLAEQPTLVPFGKELCKHIVPGLFTFSHRLSSFREIEMSPFLY